MESSPGHPLFRRGAALFNEGAFFEAHDTLEALWQETRGRPREFLQGLIQVAVGCYHAGNGNTAGALSQLGKGLDKLRRYPDAYWGVDLAAFRNAANALRAAIEAGRPGNGASPLPFPGIAFPSREG